MPHTLTKYHIYPHGFKWALKAENSDRVKLFDTQYEAVDHSTNALRNSATATNRKQLFIHGTGGRIRAERYYPKNLDPRNIPG